MSKMTFKTFKPFQLFHPPPLSSSAGDCVAIVISRRSREIFSSYVAENARSLAMLGMTDAGHFRIATQSLTGEDKGEGETVCTLILNGEGISSSDAQTCRFKSAAVDCAIQYSADTCNPRAEQSARRMAFLRAAVRSAICSRKSRTAPIVLASRLN